MLLFDDAPWSRVMETSLPTKLHDYQISSSQVISLGDESHFLLPGLSYTSAKLCFISETNMPI
ncbi:hypothetical protein COOONC_12853 [Cooperia oncophora]